MLKIYAQLLIDSRLKMVIITSADVWTSFSSVFFYNTSFGRNNSFQMFRILAKSFSIPTLGFFASLFLAELFQLKNILNNFLHALHDVALPTDFQLYLSLASVKTVSKPLPSFV